MTKILILGALVLWPALALAGGFRARVIEVKTGDTLVVERRQGPTEVRLADIFCPGADQPYGKEARQFTASRVEGTTVSLVSRGSAPQGGLLADLILPDGRSLSWHLVERGLARVVSADTGSVADSAIPELSSAFAGGLAEVQKAARNAGKGLWSVPTIPAPKSVASQSSPAPLGRVAPAAPPPAAPAEPGLNGEVQTVSALIAAHLRSGAGPVDSLLVRDLMRASSLDQRLAFFPKQIVEQLKELKDTQDFDEDLQRRLQDAAYRAFDPGKIRIRVRDRMTERLSAAESREALKWYQGRQGIHVAGQERSAFSPVDRKKQATFRSSLEERPLSSERVALIGRIDQALGAADSTLDMALQVRTALALAYDASLPVERRLGKDQIEYRIQNRRSGFEPVFRQTMQEQLAMAYSDLQDQELQEYLDFLGSAAGRSYLEATSLALRETTAEAADEMAKLLLP